MKILISFSFVLTLVVTARAGAAKPDHAVIMIFDQMRYDYVNRFDMKNFKRLIAMSTNYPNALVGHMASATIVAHPVIGTGHLPKDLPWHDNQFWDQKGTLGEKDKTYATPALSPDQLLTALKTINRSEFLSDQLLSKLKKPVFAVAQKNYAAVTMGGPYASSITFLKQDPDGHCEPDGIHVPPYVASDDRFRLDCKPVSAKTPGALVIDGAKYYPGPDKKHEGGDAWVADAAIAIMKHEAWSGLLLSFGAIDKFGHMIGEPGSETPLAKSLPVTHADIIKNADIQLGRVLDELEKQKLLAKTIIVVTSDHGVQSNVNPPPERRGKILQALEKGVKIKMYAHDTGFRFWLSDRSKENREALLRNLKSVPGVIQIFELRDNSHYDAIYEDFSQVSESVKNWARQHSALIADSAASKEGPEYVATLADQYGYSEPVGEHGGFQENVQRIPMIVYDPTVKGPKVNPKELRHADIKNVILKSMF